MDEAEWIAVKDTLDVWRVYGNVFYLVMCDLLVPPNACHGDDLIDS